MVLVDLAVSFFFFPTRGTGLNGRKKNVLSGVGSVVHHQQLDVLDVVDQEGLVARGHHVAGFLVGAETNLWEIVSQILAVFSPNKR